MSELQRSELGACHDCGRCTKSLGESFMLQMELWFEVTRTEPVRWLCVNCVEARLGRTLASQDFIDCPLNDGVYENRVIKQSDLLRERLGTNRTRALY